MPKTASVWLTSVHSCVKFRTVKQFGQSPALESAINVLNQGVKCMSASQLQAYWDPVSCTVHVLHLLGRLVGQSCLQSQEQTAAQPAQNTR